jgi:hypothetical protein
MLPDEKDPNETNGDGGVAIDPLEKAEEESREAWEDAKENVDDLKKLGHEGEESPKAASEEGE